MDKCAVMLLAENSILYVNSLLELQCSINANTTMHLPKGNAKNSKISLLQAIDGNLKLKNFAHLGDNVNLAAFSWRSQGEDRNWWWQLQALPFFNWFCEAYNLLETQEQKTAWSFLINSFRCWLSQSKEGETPLLWHDHATAFRLRNVANFVAFMLLKQRGTELECIESELIHFFNEHLEFLANDDNYSRHTNHGFDQMLVLYKFTLIFGLQNSSVHELREHARVRLLDELDFAFTTQGVHKENSPGYQIYMLKRLNDLVRLEELGDKLLARPAQELYKRAEEFLKAITLPNGDLPIIGDTELGRGSEKILSTMQVLDFSESGYVIVEGIDNNNKNFHLIFKNSFLSNYHRHDDDLSIHFFYDDKIVLGDGGLGFYKEDDHVRRHLRSAYSHSTIIVPSRKYIRKFENKVNSEYIRLYQDTIEGVTFSQGIELRRVVDFSKIMDGILIISDEQVSQERLEPFILNFFTELPVSFQNQKFTLRLGIDALITFELEVPENNSSIFLLSTECPISKKYAVLDNANRFGWEIASSKRSTVILRIGK